MTEVADIRRTTTRKITWTILAAAPALAIVTIGAGVFSGSVSSGSVPARTSMADTREFSTKGDDLAALTGAKADGTDESAMNQWQNTVRRRPSPRR